MKKMNFKLLSSIKIIFILLIFFDCSKNKNYINYYNEVNKIDSLYRFNKDTLQAIKKSRKLFRKYNPKNQERIEEYEKFIIIADHHHKHFGGQKSLFKLIPLVAPYWKYKRLDSDFFSLYKKYGIDSIVVEQKVIEWKKSLNKQLIDSFSIALVRDQQNRQSDSLRWKRKYDDRKNFELLLWTFKNFGYPSKQKIGLYGNDEVLISMGTLLNHMSESEKYDYLKVKLFDYIKAGDLPPRDYMEMVDKHNWLNKLNSEYGIFSHYDEIIDTVKVNNNRKAIGFPGLKQWGKITKDYWKNNK